MGEEGSSQVSRTFEHGLVLFRIISPVTEDSTRSIARNPLSAANQPSTFFAGLLKARYLGESRSNVGPDHKLDPFYLRLGKHDTEVFIF